MCCADWSLSPAHTHSHTQAHKQSVRACFNTHIQPGAFGKQGKQSCIEIVAAEKRGFDVLTWCFAGK